MIGEVIKAYSCWLSSRSIYSTALPQHGHEDMKILSLTSVRSSGFFLSIKTSYYSAMSLCFVVYTPVFSLSVCVTEGCKQLVLVHDQMLTRCDARRIFISLPHPDVLKSLQFIQKVLINCPRFVAQTYDKYHHTN